MYKLKNVIKFSNDKDFIKNRIYRVDQLKEYVPTITNHSENMYMYDYVEGKVLSEVINIKLFQDLLSKCKLFWKFKKLFFQSGWDTLWRTVEGLFLEVILFMLMI